MVMMVCGLVACGDNDGDGGSDAVDDAAADAGSDAVGETAEGDVEDDASAADTAAPADTVMPVECPEPTGQRPQARAEHAGVYDPVGKQLVMFGGTFGVPVNCSSIVDHTYQNEVWFFDTQCDQWRQSEAVAPTAGRNRHAAAYDPARRQMIVYGGRYRAGSSGSYTLFDDVLAFDIETETWSVIATGGPAPRHNAVAVVDPVGDQLLVFGGDTSDSGLFIQEQNDVWALDLGTGTWQQLEGTDTSQARPAKRKWVTGLWDAQRSWLVVYGGGDATAFSNTAQYFDDVWAFDLTQTPPVWYQLDVDPPQAPEGRFWPGLVHDTVNDRYVVFGGHDDQQVGNRNDTWALGPVAGSWELFSIGDTYNRAPNGFCDFPPDFTTVDAAQPERRHAQFFVAGEGHAWLVGGKTDCGNVDDVWSFDFSAGTWSERIPATVGEVCIRKGGVNCNDMCF